MCREALPNSSTLGFRSGLWLTGSRAQEDVAQSGLPSLGRGRLGRGGSQLWGSSGLRNGTNPRQRRNARGQRQPSSSSGFHTECASGSVSPSAGSRPRAWIQDNRVRGGVGAAGCVAAQRVHCPVNSAPHPWGLAL